MKNFAKQTGIKIGILGGLGKMGREIVSFVIQKDASLLGAIFETENHHLLNKKISDIFGNKEIIGEIRTLTQQNIDTCSIFIDFSIPVATMSNLKLLSRFSKDSPKAIVIGTTGFLEEEEEQIREYAKVMPILKSANMSLGVNLISKLSKKVAKILSKEDFDIEIVESHHKFKKDAPSGTALLFGEAVAQGRNISLREYTSPNRNNHNLERKNGVIGFSSIRGGGIIGEHRVSFLGMHEEITIIHKAISRELFAAGALQAVLFLQNQKNGFYTMNDVLNLN